MSGIPLSERYAVALLERRHDRKAFRCGGEALDRTLHQQAGQDARRDVATVLVAEEQGSGAIHGFYTLSMAAVLLDKLPDDLQRKMPRYPTVPAVRLGRLAVAKDIRGAGLGVHLLMDAMTRSLANEIAWAAFVVDTRDDKARSFYEKYDFQSFLDDANHLFLPRKTIEPLPGVG
ncbi:MAG: GNAT superfamily N-acetyltransferase [Myxococcota bacterium]|jgi:GNAT superfamily N-acetyltransferase